MRIDWNILLNVITICMLAVWFITEGKRHKAWWLLPLLREESGASLERKMQSFNLAIIAIITIDDNSIIITANRTIETVFGWTEIEAKGNNITMMMPERFHQLHTEAMRRSKLNDHKNFKERTVRLFGKRKDNTEFPMDLTLKKETDKGKTVFIGIVQDVTKQVETLIALENINGELRCDLKLLEVGEGILKCGSWCWTVTGENKGMVRVSKGFKEIFDVDEDELPVDSLLNRVWAADKQAVSENIQLAFKGRRYTDLFYRVIRKDASVAHIMARGEPEMKDGVMIKLHGTIELKKVTDYEHAGIIEHG